MLKLYNIVISAIVTRGVERSSSRRKYIDTVT
jgi:hypothetical protein